MIRAKAPRLLALVALLVLVTACAPRLRTGPEHRTDFMVDDDEHQAENREALQELMERPSEDRAAEAENTNARHDRSGYDLPVLPVTVLAPEVTDAERGEGQIERDGLRTFVEGGPHQLFRAVLLEPVMNDDRFQGYRVASIAAEPSELRESGLRVGDVVTAVNGTDISRPEGFMRVWEGLPDADELRVEIVRDGDAQILAWAIE